MKIEFYIFYYTLRAAFFQVNTEVNNYQTFICFLVKIAQKLLKNKQPNFQDLVKPIQKNIAGYKIIVRIPSKTASEATKIESKAKEIRIRSQRNPHRKSKKSASEVKEICIGSCKIKCRINAKYHKLFILEPNQ